MHLVQNDVEIIARAFYDAQDCARGWEREPEQLKRPFRQHAQAAIAAIKEYWATSQDVPEPRFATLPETDDAHQGRCEEEPGSTVAVQTTFQACIDASQTSARLVARSREQIRYSRTRIARSLALLRNSTL